ncbi:MAG TPA: response regulator, partial [Candidatus Methylomirabilis sp.]|nr:response regulator [Candidatus Methylomirabilis sp.]
NIGRLRNKPALLFGYPLKDESGRITDMAIVSFSLDKYDRFFQSKGLVTDASLALLDHKGTVLFARPFPALIGQQDREDLFRRMTAGPDEGSFDAAGLSGIHRVFTYRKLRLPGEPQPYMYVRAGISVSSILDRTRKDFLFGMGSIGVVAILILLAGILVSKRFILDKVAALKETTQRISRGDLGARVPEIVSGGDLGELGNAFDNMARRLQEADAERRESEEEKLNRERQVQRSQKLESLGVLAGGIAHEFNNLLMVILGHAELALGAIPPTSPARGSLTEITTASRRAADLSHQMLAYAGKASFALERVELGELVEEMAHLLEAAISKKAILKRNLDRGLPPIQADLSQIRQVVMNLIINASEALGDRDGVITVSVGATRCDEEYLRKTELAGDLSPGLYVHLEVTDTGVGMDVQTRARIFEPFFSTKFIGRGLGLSAVLGIVRAHKGALTVYSEPGKGTVFKVLFPASEVAVEGALSNKPSPMADWKGTGTILLVDDEESLLALGARMLEDLGLTVLTAPDGRKAVDLYRERGKEIDLVLMDLTMPHMDGAEAFGELRRLNPSVRVVLASGYSPEDVTSRFPVTQLDGVLQKPYTLSMLREALAALLPKRPEGKR